MKKLILCSLMALGLTFTAVAGDNNSLFNKGEVGLTLGTGYDVGAANGVNGETLFNDPYTINLSAGMFYFPTKNLGFEVNVPFYQTEGVSVEEVQAGLLLRVPVFTYFAPYIGVSGVYNWQEESDWAYIGKVGVEIRTNPNWGIFIQGDYRNDDFSNWDQGNIGLSGGVRFVL